MMQTWNSDEPTGLAGDNVLPAWYELGKTFGSPFKECFLTTPEGTKVWHNRLSYWPTKPWDSKGGLVTLAGDSAHPMTFRKSRSFPSLYRFHFYTPFLFYLNLYNNPS